MRREKEASGSPFSYVDLDACIPARHPLPNIRQVVNEAQTCLDALYTDFGRPSISLERLIRPRLFQILYWVHYKPRLIEEMQLNWSTLMQSGHLGEAEG